MTPTECLRSSSGFYREQQSGSSRNNNYRTPSNTKVYKVNTILLNVRSGPGLQHPIVAQLHNGYSVNVEAVYGNGWCRIKFINNNGKNNWGYVVFRHIRK